ncbi:MAG: DNA-binding protein WhiA [Acutalibacteraceae bacterium]|jgi:DNA-binding protein WhiA|nr:DNA-binding protein WhiA [Clostridiales bacterium]
MSFSSSVKKELIDFENSRIDDEINYTQCCTHAQQYGLLLFCRGFSVSGINMQTENESIAKMYAKTIEQITGQIQPIKCSAAGKYSVSVQGEKKRKKVIEHFGYTGSEITLRINRANLLDECCYSAFLRGAFLACGTITSPKKEYHLEFVATHFNLCKDLMKVMEDMDLLPKYVMRKGNHITYFKDSESIEDVLTHMGAIFSSLELMEIKIYKDVRNKVNRRTNFENANLTKTVDAAFTQMQAIELIKKEKGMSYFPEELRELAVLRLDNPELSLRELGQMLSVPLSRSGVNHRLKKIIQMADDLKNSEQEKGE